MVEALAKVKRDLNVPDMLTTTFQGNAQALQDSLKTQPLLILAAVTAIYIILGMLYESSFTRSRSSAPSRRPA